MAFTEFCCRSGGSNLNAGTRTGSSTEPGTSAALTYASGNWVQSTGVFTVASGDPSADGVAVGDFASVYADGASVTGFVGRVTARDTTTITVSLTAMAGTAPTDGTGNRTLKIGGAWQGPNAAEAFPFGFIKNTLTDASGNQPRVNLKDAADYNITAAMTHANTGPLWFEGYTSSYGDGGSFSIDGGTSGASYVLLTMSASNCGLIGSIWKNNGATGSSSGVVVSGSEQIIDRFIAHDLRGSGLDFTTGSASISEVECYGCNQSNTSGHGGMRQSNIGSFDARRAILHHNTGSNNNGFAGTSGNNACRFTQSIFHANGRYGASPGTTTRGGPALFENCDFYDNGSDGLMVQPDSGHLTNVDIENCNFLANGGYGILLSEGTGRIIAKVSNCGFGQGTEANASGTVSGPAYVMGSVLYTADTTPWSDPDDGDFSIASDSEAAGAGRGSFLQTQSGYGDPSPTTANIDIGAGQHADPAGGGGGLLVGGGFTGGMQRA